MKKLSYKIKAIFKSDFPCIEPDETGYEEKTAKRTPLANNKGETIVEVMVAFVILLIYLAAITTTITASLRITTLATTNAKFLQEQVINPVVLGEYQEESEIPGEITFSGEIILSDVKYNLSTTHEIRFNTESNLPGFVPVVPTEEP
jgi:hypothetical protein